MSNKAARLSSESSAGSRKSGGRRSASEGNLSSEAEALSDGNKENVERLSEVQMKLCEVVTSSPAVASVLSPILPPPSPSPSALPKEPEQDPVWPQKVRRSYGRLSVGDRSFESPKPLPAPSTSPNTRQTLFGFARLQTPEVMRKAEGSRLSFSVGSFDISAADDSASNPPEIDPNIPGVCLGKRTARRKRVQQIKMSELDVLAAEMNAEFEEAESFELFVE